MTSERPGALAFAWFGAVLFFSSLLLVLYAYFVTFGRLAPPGPAAPEVLMDAGLFSIFALHHSVFARNGPKSWMTRLVSPALERSVYTWIASLLLIAVCLLWRLVPGQLYELRGLLAAPCFAIQFVGVLLTIRSSSTLGILDLAGVRQAVDASDRSKTSAESRPGARYTGTHGSVAPDAGSGKSACGPSEAGSRRARALGGGAPSALSKEAGSWQLEADHAPLVTTGLYGFVRHPLYFSWLLVVFGTPQMTMTRLTFAIVSSAYLAIAIPFEERGLIRVFGDDYRRYQRQVRWRMLPGVY